MFALIAAAATAVATPVAKATTLTLTPAQLSEQFARREPPRQAGPSQRWRFMPPG